MELLALAGASVLGGIALTVGAVTYAGVSGYRRHRRRNRADGPRYQQRVDFKSEAEACIEDETRDAYMRQQAKLRLDEELDTTRGEPVYFSRRVKGGDLTHWVISCHQTSYELRLRTVRRAISGATLTSVVPTKSWEAEKKPWDRVRDCVANHQEAMRETGRPHTEDDKFTVALIGWTTFTPTQIDDAVQGVADSFGYYMLGFNDCQTYVRSLANLIISPYNRAMDWKWFSENALGSYTEVVNMKPDHALQLYQAALFRARMRRLEQQTQNSARQAYQSQQQSSAQNYQQDHQRQQNDLLNEAQQNIFYYNVAQQSGMI